VLNGSIEACGAVENVDLGWFLEGAIEVLRDIRG
jgi:hypothetical protein